MNTDDLAAHWDSAYRHVYRICGNRMDAEDAVQEGYVALLERLQAGYAPTDDNPRGLVWAFVRRRAWHLMRHYKALRRHDIVDTWALAAWDEYADPYEVARARAVLDRLPQVRQAVLLAYFSGWTVPELAQLVGTDRVTLKSRLRRAEKAVRRMYNGVCSIRCGGPDCHRGAG